MRPNILYLVHRVPYPPDKGDRIRAFHLLRFLSQRASVHLACLADEPTPPETLDALHQYCERVAVIPLGSWSRWASALGSLAAGKTVTEGAFSSIALREALRKWAIDTKFQVTVASASSMVPYLQMPELRGVPSVIDLVDADSQKWLDYADVSNWPMNWLYDTEGQRLRQVEKTLPSWARAVTLVSEAEADLYRGYCEAGEVHAVTNGVDLDYFRPPEPSPVVESACVFVGALDYRPNVDAACWFCQEVWPRIRQARPRAEMWLVGRQPTPAVQKLAEIGGVKVVGQVPDVRPYMANAAVVVAPLRLARGLQNKVLEALAMGKAVVASPQALAGLTHRAEIPVLSAGSAEEWVEHVLGLLDSEPFRRDLGTRGRRYVEQYHDWSQCLAPFGVLLGLNSPGPADVSASHRN